MPYGLRNAPATYCVLLSHVLRGIPWSTCLAYIDDIIIFSNSFEEHLEHLELIFDRLRQANLTLKPSKCVFAASEVIYLGHKFSTTGIKVDESKINTVTQFPIPKTQKNVRSFLGLCNYYRKFVQGYSTIAVP